MKLLIVSPHFPPSALPPSIRVRMFVKYFEEFGIIPSVLTLDSSDTNDIEDDFLSKCLESEFKVHYAKAIEKSRARKIGIGDVGIRMLPFLYSDLKKTCKEEKPDAMLFLVPPWYILIVATLFSKKNKIPYFIDYIDPWVAKRKIAGIKSLFLKTVSSIAEGYTAKNSKGIISVSQGVFEGLTERHPSLKKKPQLVLPYGVDLSDIAVIKDGLGLSSNEKLIIRYIGAISDSMIPVVKVLLKVFSKINELYPIQLDFIGTNYGGSKGKLHNIISGNKYSSFIREYPKRVSYKEALALTITSDITFLLGDLTKYYAASKLMGLIASRTKFFVFAHEASFPSQLMGKINYPFNVHYNENNYAKKFVEDQLFHAVRGLIENNNFQPIDISADWFQEYTAKGMVKKISDFIKCT